MRAPRDVPVALLPPRPLSRLTLERLTKRSNPLTSAGRDLTNGPLHSVVVGQPIGTLRNKVRAKPTARFPPCRPRFPHPGADGGAVREGGRTPETRAGSGHPPPHF